MLRFDHPAPKVTAEAHPFSLVLAWLRTPGLNGPSALYSAYGRPAWKQEGLLTTLAHMATLRSPSRDFQDRAPAFSGLRTSCGFWCMKHVSSAVLLPFCRHRRMLGFAVIRMALSIFLCKWATVIKTTDLYQCH